MVVKIEIEIQNCNECPFAVKVNEMGYHAIECSKLECYSAIPKQGIRKDCPFKNA